MLEQVAQACVAPLQECVKKILVGDDSERHAQLIVEYYETVMHGLRDASLTDARSVLRSLNKLRCKLVLRLCQPGRDSLMDGSIRRAHGILGLGGMILTGGAIVQQRRSATEPGCH